MTTTEMTTLTNNSDPMMAPAILPTLLCGSKEHNIYDVKQYMDGMLSFTHWQSR